MGITFHPTNKVANAHVYQTEGDPETSTAQAVFETSYSSMHGDWYKGNLYNSSFPTSFPCDPTVMPVNNGLVDTVVKAYSHHHALIIRPDDIWLAILVQFNFSVNANSEQLRSSFVSHADKKDLAIDIPPTELSSIPVDELSSRFTELMHENFTDPSVREWILPNFSTTRDVDRTVASIVMMSTFKAYFNFWADMECGLPSVTLEGEKRDYQSILRRIEKLKEYGVNCVAWYHLLRPVLRRFIRAFDDPEGEDNKDFWNRVVTEEHRGSGMDYLSGWINAFCVFNRDGKWIGPNITKKENDDCASLSAAEFASAYLRPSSGLNSLVLDGIPYHRIDLNRIPPSCVEVNITIRGGGRTVNAAMMAGLCAYRVQPSNTDAAVQQENGDQQRAGDTISPVSGWWLYEQAASTDDL